ncbi:hypothetical protein ACRRTK_001528 [Alexandromys fortis]
MFRCRGHSASRLRLDPVWPERTRRFRSLRKPCTLLSQSPEACAPQVLCSSADQTPIIQPGPTRDSGMAPGSVSRPPLRRQRRLADRRDRSLSRPLSTKGLVSSGSWRPRGPAGICSFSLS